MVVKSIPSCTISHNGLTIVSLLYGQLTSLNLPHLSEPVDGPDNLLDDKVNLGLCGKPADAKAKRGVGHVLCSPQGAENVRRLQRRRGTRTP
jgi:hypothetical protein